MDIQLVSSHGEGQTLLSAFDTALFHAGVQDFNLLYLSSVIPAGSNLVEVEKAVLSDAAYGDRLYVVHADARSDQKGRFIAAGIGWYQFSDDKRGVFVEHSCEGGTQEGAEKLLRSLLQSSLEDLCKIRGLVFDSKDFGYKVSVGQVGDLPKCVLALAVYQSDCWSL